MREDLSFMITQPKSVVFLDVHHNLCYSNVTQLRIHNVCIITLISIISQMFDIYIILTEKIVIYQSYSYLQIHANINRAVYFLISTLLRSHANKMKQSYWVQTIDIIESIANTIHNYKDLFGVSYWERICKNYGSQDPFRIEINSKQR